MKNVLMTAALLFFVACESTSENGGDRFKLPEHLTVDVQGYVTLNQGSISSIDYYNLAGDSLTSGMYQLQNNAETLSGYAEQIIRTENYFIVSMQGDYGTGTNGKVIFLDYAFNNIGEITSFPVGYNTINILFEDDVLYVSYRKGNWPNTDLVKLRAYSISENNGEVSGTQLGSDYDATIGGYGYGSLTKLGDDLVSFGANMLELVDTSTLTLTDTIRFAESLHTAMVHNKALYVGYTEASKALEGKGKGEAPSAGGIFVFEDGSVVDTIKTNYGVRKLLQGDYKLFAVYGNALGEISGSTISQRFTHSYFYNINSSYVHVNYDYTHDTFYIPDGNYVDGQIDIVTSSGQVLKTITHKGQVTAALPVGF